MLKPFFDRTVNKKFKTYEMPIVNILNTYNPTTKSFQIGQKNIYPAKFDIEQSYGLSVGEVKIVLDYYKKESTEDGIENLFTGITQISESAIRNRLGLLLGTPDTVENAQLFAKLVCMLFLACYFETSSSKYVPRGCCKYIDDLDEMKNYDWSSEILSSFNKHSRKMDIDNVRSCKGCVPFLVYFLCEHTTIAKPSIPNVFPRFLKWDQSKVKDVIISRNLARLNEDEVHTSKLKFTVVEKKFKEKNMIKSKKNVQESEEESEEGEDDSEEDEDEIEDNSEEKSDEDIYEESTEDAQIKNFKTKKKKDKKVLSQSAHDSTANFTNTSLTEEVELYGLSWLVITAVMVILKIVSMGRKKFSADFQLMFRLLKLILFIGFIVTLGILFTFLSLTVGDIFASLLAFMPTGWAILQILQACRPVVKAVGMRGSVKALARGYEYMMALVIFTPVVVLTWFPFVSEFQTRLLFNQAFSRGLQIQRSLAGGKKQK